MRKTLTAIFAFTLLFVAVSDLSAQKTAKSRINPFVEKDKTMAFAETHAYSDGNGVWFKWSMANDNAVLGFDIFRLTSTGREQVNPSVLIAGQMDRGFYFQDGQYSDVFEIEGIRYDGTRFTSQRFTTEFVSRLIDVAGRSAEDLATSTSNGDIETTTLVLPKDLQNEVGKSRQQSDLAMQRFLATQVGVKIGIRTDGLYRVMKADLLAAGFDVAGDPTKWQLFGNGAEQAIIVGPSANYIEFYAKAINTIESDTRYYFLINGATAGKRIGTRVSRPVGSPVIAKNYQNEYKYSQKRSYISDILNGDAENYWGAIITNSTAPAASVTFNVTGIDTTSTKSQLQVSLQGFSTTQHAVNVSLNGNALGVITGNFTNPFSSDFLIQTSFLVEGVNTLTFNTTTAGDLVLFDSVKVNYARRFAADQNRTAFFTTGYRRSTVTGFTTQNIRLFDTTTEGEPVQVTDLSISPNGPTFDLSLPAYRSRVFYAMEDTAFLTPASIIPNYASSLATPGHTSDFLIVSHGDLLTQAEAWANYRRGQGITAEVVDIADVFDEFNFGMAGSAPLSAFLNYAKTNWQTPPRYVLFLGDGSYDPKNYENRGFQNMVPVKMITTVYTETGSDEALADFNGDGLAEMAVGRIPAKLPIEVTNALAKVMAFETPAMQNINRGAIFAYDVPNGYDFNAMSHILAAELPVGVPKTFVSRGLPPPNEMIADPAAQGLLVGAVNGGKYLVNFSGHGTTGAWVNTGFFSVQNFNGAAGFPQVSNASAQSLWVMLTCLNGYFMNPFNDSLSEVMLKSTNGGSVANWASTGKTTPDIQLVMGQRFFNKIGGGTVPRIGDLIMDAKTTIPGGSDVRLSWALMGDPMLKVR